MTRDIVRIQGAWFWKMRISLKSSLPIIHNENTFVENKLEHVIFKIEKALAVIFQSSIMWFRMTVIEWPKWPFNDLFYLAKYFLEILIRIIRWAQKQSNWIHELSLILESYWTFVCVEIIDAFYALNYSHNKVGFPIHFRFTSGCPSNFGALKKTLITMNIRVNIR